MRPGGHPDKVCWFMYLYFQGMTRRLTLDASIPDSPNLPSLASHGALPWPGRLFAIFIVCIDFLWFLGGGFFSRAASGARGAPANQMVCPRSRGFPVRDSWDSKYDAQGFRSPFLPCEGRPAAGRWAGGQISQMLGDQRDEFACLFCISLLCFYPMNPILVVGRVLCFSKQCKPCSYEVDTPGHWRPFNQSQGTLWTFFCRFHQYTCTK